MGNGSQCFGPKTQSPGHVNRTCFKGVPCPSRPGPIKAIFWKPRVRSRLGSKTFVWFGFCWFESSGYEHSWITHVQTRSRPDPSVPRFVHTETHSCRYAALLILTCAHTHVHSAFRTLGPTHTKIHSYFHLPTPKPIHTRTKPTSFF